MSAFFRLDIRYIALAMNSKNSYLHLLALRQTDFNRLKNFVMKKNILFILFIVSINAYALIPGGSLGDLSDKLLLPMSLLTGALYNMSLAIGIALLFGSLIQYKNYRNNPSQVPLSRPITLLIFGVVLVVLPILTKFSESSHLVSRVS